MAAYRWVDALLTCGLTACTLGSSLGPMLGNEYGKPLPSTVCGSVINTTNSPVGFILHSIVIS